MDARVLLPEPMLRFRCNQKGCCCSGWDIPFTVDDYVRLHKHVDEDDRKELDKVSFVVLQRGEEMVLKRLKLDSVGDDAACRFLGADSRCGVQVKYGMEALPNVCVNFPVLPYTAQDGRVELYFEAICPEVLNQIGESDEPLRLVERTAPFDDQGFALRARNAAGLPVIKRGESVLDAAALDRIRGAVTAALADFSRPAWEQLSAIAWSFARFAAGATGAEEFAVTHHDDTQPFMAFLYDCISAHGPELLNRAFLRYRRFIWSLDKDDPRWAALPEHLGRWGPAIDTWIEPQEKVLRPLLLRFLAHRFFAPFFPVDGELEFAASAIAHRFGTSLRYAAALAACLERPVDKEIMKVALGLGEFLYRWVRIPRGALPWFAPPGIDVPIPPLAL